MSDRAIIARTPAAAGELFGIVWGGREATLAGLREAQQAERDAWAAFDLAADEPTEDQLAWLPEVFSHEARMERWRRAAERVGRCRRAIRRFEAHLQELEATP